MFAREPRTVIVWGYCGLWCASQRPWTSAGFLQAVPLGPCNFDAGCLRLPLRSAGTGRPRCASEVPESAKLATKGNSELHGLGGVSLVHYDVRHLLNGTRADLSLGRVAPVMLCQGPTTPRSPTDDDRPHTQGKKECICCKDSINTIYTLGTLQLTFCGNGRCVATGATPTT